MANDKGSGFKRRFPRLNKCCCCLSLKTGVYVFSILYLIFALFGLFGMALVAGAVDFETFFKLVSVPNLILFIIYIVSLVILIIGINKTNISLMVQFKYIYGLYIICNLILNIYVYYDLFIKKHYKDKMSDILLTLYEKTGNYRYQEMLMDGTVDDVFDSQKSSQFSSLVFGFLIQIYYYIATCSLIEDYEEAAYEEDFARNIENNNNAEESKTEGSATEIDEL